MFDAIVVGAGPAGLTAGMVLGRCRRKVLVCDSGIYRNARSRGLHFFLTRDGVPPHDFLKMGREELTRYPTIEYRNLKVTDAHCKNGRFEVVFEGGQKEHSRKMLIATGMVDQLPEIPGMKSFYGSSIFHCPYCDGWEVQDFPIAIYGRGEKGKGLSLELTAWSKDLVLCTDGPSDLEENDIQSLTRNGIRMVEDRIERLEGKEGQLEQIIFQNGQIVQRRALFFTLGQHQRSDLPTKLGCEMTEKKAVRTGRHEETGIAGLYIAGDASESVHFAIVAAAEGAQAAFSIHQELLKEDLK